MEKLTPIKKCGSRVKVFKPFEDKFNAQN